MVLETKDIHFNHDFKQHKWFYMQKHQEQSEQMIWPQHRQHLCSPICQAKSVWEKNSATTCWEICIDDKNWSAWCTTCICSSSDHVHIHYTTTLSWLYLISQHPGCWNAAHISRYFSTIHHVFSYNFNFLKSNQVTFLSDFKGSLKSFTTNSFVMSIAVQ